jgi:BirA family biotin operon repressor/biotin-[acetyl-CoA-carboxylase] ligase
MTIIKVNATDSTNEHLKRMMAESAVEDFTVLSATDQFHGRGQQGALWHSEAGKNLTFSVLKYFDKLKAEDQFLISMVVSLAIYKSLQCLKIPQISIKWPNDIMAGKKKICGILIENTIKGTKLKYSVLGIGLNINQESFKNLPLATSLFQITGRFYSPEEVLDAILGALRDEFAMLQTGGEEALRNAYHAALFRKDKPAVFEIQGQQFLGIIRGVAKGGELLLEREDKGIEPFGYKEIVYCL